MQWVSVLHCRSEGGSAAQVQGLQGEQEAGAEVGHAPSRKLDIMKLVQLGLDLRPLQPPHVSGQPDVDNNVPGKAVSRLDGLHQDLRALHRARLASGAFLLHLPDLGDASRKGDHDSRVCLVDTQVPTTGAMLSLGHEIDLGDWATSS